MTNYASLRHLFALVLLMNNLTKNDEADYLTQQLQQWRMGDTSCLNQIMPPIFNQLQSIARRCFKSENSGHTLQATALVNEAYLHLIKADIDWRDRAHFFAVAARQMRRILVDHAKSKGRFKRGGHFAHQSLSDTIASSSGNVDEFVIIEELLTQMESFDERAARVFELKFYGGLSVKEIAQVEKLSTATIERDLRAAKAWIEKELL